MKQKLMLGIVTAFFVGLGYLSLSAVSAQAAWLNGSYVQTGYPVKVFMNTQGTYYSCSGTLWFLNDEPWPVSDFWERTPGYWVYSYSSGGYTDFVINNYDWFHWRLSSGTSEGWRYGSNCYQ